MTMPTNRNGSTWTAQPMYHHFQEDDLHSHGSTPTSSIYSNEEPYHIDVSSTESRTSQNSRRDRRPPPRGSRRASLGGTTVYKTPEMARMDAFLRSSGLRLKPDGTCQFLFETTRFIIETTTDMEEAGEFLLYCSLGQLKHLRENFGSQRKLLKMLAVWNEELQEEGGDDTGLLRIDSSKEDGPHVSFIYYGQMKNIHSGDDFQALLDEFVDDALEFHDRLNGCEEEEEVAQQQQHVQRNSRGSGGGTHHVGSSKSLKSHSTSTTASTLSSEESGTKHGNHGSRGNSFHRASPPPSPPSATSSAVQTSELAMSSTSINNNPPEKGGASTKKFFSKVMSSLQKKNDPTVAMAFIDPSNPTSAFVVDKNAASNMPDESLKPKIVISRKGAEKKGASFHSDGRDTIHHPKRHTKSFHDDKSTRTSRRTSLPDVQEQDSTGRRNSTISKRSSQPSIGDDSYDRSSCHSHSKAKKSTSFHDSKRPSISVEDSCRKTKSFHVGKNRRTSIEPETNMVEKRTSHNTSFNKSVDIFNDSGTFDHDAHGNNKSGNFNYSEPLLPSHVKPKKSSRKVKVQDAQHQHGAGFSSSKQDYNHRRKTLNDAVRPKLQEKQRKAAYPLEDRALKAYYERHNAYPPPPPRNGSKWCMEDYESDECSGEEEGLYD